MSVAIRYYTRTGNTEKLANAIASVVGVNASTVENKLEEHIDTLLLGCSYYAFDMDEEVKKFIKENQANIGKIVLFGTSAMIKSMKKPLAKLLKDVEANIEVAEDEFHCPGTFGRMHKGRPNEADIEAAKEFAKKYKV